MTPYPPNHSLHTVEDSAARLRVHPKTVLRFIRDGKLRATRVGRAYRILDTDFAAFAPTEPAVPIPSAPSRPPLAGDAYAQWLDDVLDGLLRRLGA